MGRAGARDFSLAFGRGDLTVAARADRWNLLAIYGLFPRLAERRGNMGNQLSGGEQQMLAIARSLMTNPWCSRPLRFSARLALSWSNRCA